VDFLFHFGTLRADISWSIFECRRILSTRISLDVSLAPYKYPVNFLFLDYSDSCSPSFNLITGSYNSRFRTSIGRDFALYRRLAVRECVLHPYKFPLHRGGNFKVDVAIIAFSVVIVIISYFGTVQSLVGLDYYKPIGNY
jgi:hypothetical protein